MAIRKKVLIDLPSDQILFGTLDTLETQPEEGTLGDATDVAFYDLTNEELAYYNEVINDPEYAVCASYYGLTAEELFKVQLEESRATDALDIGV